MQVYLVWKDVHLNEWMAHLPEVLEEKALAKLRQDGNELIPVLASGAIEAISMIKNKETAHILH